MVTEIFCGKVKAILQTTAEYPIGGYRPDPVSTALAVITRILKSLNKDQVSMCLRSSFIHSSKLKSFRCAAICHRQVMPGIQPALAYLFQGLVDNVFNLKRVSAPMFRTREIPMSSRLTPSDHPIIAMRRETSCPDRS